MLKRSRIVVITLFACALIGACSSPPPKPGPKFTGRLIVLSGGGDLVEIATDANSTFKRSALVNGITEAVASPDQTQLLYATKDSIVLRKLSTSEVDELIKGTSYCLAWSPDGKQFSYKQRSESSIKLFVSDLNDNSKLVGRTSS